MLEFGSGFASDPFLISDHLEIIRGMQKTHRIRAAIICTFTLWLAASLSCRDPHVPRAAEYEVLSAFIDAKLSADKGVLPLSPEGEGISRLVIRRTSVTDVEGELDRNGQPIPWAQTASSLQSQVPSLKRATTDAFQKVNKTHSTFRRLFPIVFDYEILGTDELNSAFENGSWTAFYKQYPGSTGVLGFSRVGINGDGTQALFYASNNCGGLCGGGTYVIMAKQDGRWVIDKEIEMWVS